MKILVFSDTHASLRFMRSAIEKISPSHVIHLGDYYEDAKAVADEFPTVRFHQVPGNCDKYRMTENVPETMCYSICGVVFYMTHGHLQNVKYGLYELEKRALQSGANVALFGHTHSRYCRQSDEGLWVINPGCAGSSCLITVENEKFVSSEFITEDML